jgi:hypothetical protein
MASRTPTFPVFAAYEKGADALWLSIGPIFKLLAEPLELEPDGERQHAVR